MKFVEIDGNLINLEQVELIELDEAYKTVTVKFAGHSSWFTTATEAAAEELFAVLKAEAAK